MARIEISIELQRRLLCWAAYEYKFLHNLQGWPKESNLYRFQREGFLSSDGVPKTSKIPYDYSEEADYVNGYVNLLIRESKEKAEAFYLYYVFHINVKEYAERLKISPRTFYKRVNAARDWFARNMPL